MAAPKFTVKGAEALLGAAFTYAFTGVLVREVSSMWGDKAQVAARWGLVFVFLLIYDLSGKLKARVPRRQLKYAVALGLTFSISVLLFTLAVLKTTLANSLFVFYATNMIASFILGSFWLKEAVTGTKILAIALALAGLSLYTHSLLIGSLGIIFSLLAGISEGFSNVWRKKLKGADRNAILEVQYAVGTVFITFLTIISGDRFIRHVSLNGSALTIFFAILLILASNLLLYGYQYFDVNIGTVILSTELVFGALLGWLFFQEVPAAHELLGGGLIFVGSIVGGVDFKKFFKQNE